MLLKFTIFTTIVAVTYFGVEIFRRWSWRRSFLDMPNERSSHYAPTPRGGGLIIAAVFLLCWIFYTNFVSHTFSYGYLVGALLIAAVSWLDDLFDISAAWRFAAHSAAAVLIIYTLGYFERAAIPFLPVIELGKFGAVFTFLWIVWLTNAYNFMDGIDGIAAVQAVTAGIGWLLVGEMLGFEVIAVTGGAAAAAGLGFLMHNWQPAKIFMGDVGSAFLGFTFAVMPLLADDRHSSNYKYLPLIAAALVGLFLLDTVFTLLRRIFNKEKIWRAHRTHIYQRLVVSGYSHRAVASLYALLSAAMVGIILLWLTFKS